MNADQMDFSALLKGPAAAMYAFAERMRTAEESTCTEVVTAIGKVIKGEQERPYAKLRALQVNITQTLHACLLQKNPLFAIETAKKLLSKLGSLGQYQRTSADPNRGANIFNSSEAEDQLDSAEFLRFLLRSLRIWASLFPDESDRILNLFSKTYLTLQRGGVAFPEDAIDLEQLNREIARLEATTSQSQFNTVSDTWMTELQAKASALQAHIRCLSRQAAMDYNEPLEMALAAVESYKDKKTSRTFFTAQPPSQSEFDGGLFRTEKMKAKTAEEQKTSISPDFDFGYEESEEDEFEFNGNPNVSDSPPYSPTKQPSPLSKNAENRLSSKKAEIQPTSPSMEFEFDDWQTPDTYTTASIPITQEIKRPDPTRELGLEIERLKATIAAKEKEAASLRDANKSLLEEKSRYKTTLKALQAEAQKEAAAAKDSQRQITEKELVSQDLRSQIQRLQTDLKTAKRTSEEAELKAIGLQTKLEITEQNAALKLAELRKTYESSQKGLQERVAELEKSLIEANKAVEAAKSLAAAKSKSSQPSRHSSTDDAEYESSREASKQQISSQARSDLRKTNPFEESSLRVSMPTIIRDVNNKWYQSHLTLREGILYEDPGLRLDFQVKSIANVVMMQITLRAKVPVRIEEMKIEEGFPGTKQAGWLFN